MRATLIPAERLDRSVTEKELSAYVTELLDLHKWLWYHTYDSRRSNPGFPDIVAVRNGVILFIELKRQLGRVSQSQDDWLAALELCLGQNVYSYVWRPSQMREIAELLR